MKVLKRILSLPLFQIPLTYSKKITLPGFEGLSIYNVLKFFIEGCMESSLTMRASSLSFRFFLALFPMLLFLFSLIPYIPIDGFQNQILELMSKILPESTSEATQKTILDIINNKREGLLSLGFLSTLYLSMNGTNALLLAFNNSSHLKHFKKNILKQYLTAFILLLILVSLIIISVSLVIFGQNIVDYLIDKQIMSEKFTVIANIIKYLIILFFYFFGISTIYYLGNIKGEKFKFISAGSTFTTLFSILLSLGFAYYVNHFANYNKLYGSIGTLIVVMLWIYFNSLVLLIGFEINASINHAKRKQ